MKKIYALVASSVIAFAALSQTTTTFNYTGAMQTFIVPGCVTSLTVDVVAGSGGTINTSAIGGSGGRVQCTFAVTPGETLQIYVGGAGTNANGVGVITGGFNGGGDGWDDTDSWGGAGGGGASDIRRTPFTLNERIVVAGGGGGGGIDGCNSANLLNGGHGGGLIGANGMPSPNSCIGSGQGGTQTAGGLKGQYTGCNNSSTDGAFGIGGLGYGNCTNGDDGGSGGGGGWYGGGAGNFGAGAGGSSYTDGSCTAVTHTQGFQVGDGYIVITHNPGFNLVLSAAQDTICQGGQTSLTANGGNTYTWSPSNTLSCSNCQNPVASPTVTTCYAVTSSNGNCTTTDTICVTVENCVGIIDNNNALTINVAPNPFTNQLMLGNVPPQATVQIFNLLGALQQSTTATHANMLINTATLPSGIYLLKVNYQQGEFVTRIIKQ